MTYTGGAHLTQTLKICENLSRLSDTYISDQISAVKLKLVTKLSMMSSGNPLGTRDYDLKVSKIDQLFITYTTIPSYRGVLGITISNLKGN